MKALADGLRAWLTARARAEDARILRQYMPARRGSADVSSSSAGMATWGGGEASGGGCDAGGGGGSC